MTITENIIKTICIILATIGITIIMSAESEPHPIKIGVVDSGVDQIHGFFRDRVVIPVTLNENEKLNQNDQNGHGTHVTGIIVARTYKNSEIYSFKNLYDYDDKSTSIATNEQSSVKSTSTNSYSMTDDHFQDFENIIEKANQLGIKILNISEYIATPTVDYLTLIRVFKKAENYGMIVVVASGNDRVNLEALSLEKNVYPCALKLSNMICVGNISDELEVNSNFGKNYVDVWAKGTNVISSYKDNMYIRMTGSSMAAPKISALISRIWANNPHLDYKQVRELTLAKLIYSPHLAMVSTYGLYLDK